MTQDEIIAMAKLAGFEFEMQQALSGEHMLFTDGSVSIGRMQRLVALVAAKEREACAQIVMDAGFRSNGTPAYEHIADKISARGAA